MDGSGYVYVADYFNHRLQKFKPVADGSGGFNYVFDTKWGSNGTGDGQFWDPRGIAVDSSGNVVVTGYTVSVGFYNDFYTAKYAAADGALLWEQIYNSPADKEDTARAVALDGGMKAWREAGYPIKSGKEP